MLRLVLFLLVGLLLAAPVGAWDLYSPGGVEMPLTYSGPDIAEVGMPDPESHIISYASYQCSGDLKVNITTTNEIEFAATFGSPHPGADVAFGICTASYRALPWQVPLYESDFIGASLATGPYEARLRVRFSQAALASLNGTCMEYAHVCPNATDSEPNGRMDLVVGGRGGGYCVAGSRGTLANTSVPITDAGSELGGYVSALQRLLGTTLNADTLNDWLKARPDGYVGMRVNPAALCNIAWERFGFPLGLRFENDQTQDFTHWGAFFRPVESMGYDNRGRATNFVGFYWDEKYHPWGTSVIVHDSMLASECILADEDMIAHTPQNNRCFYQMWLPSNYYSPWFTGYPAGLDWAKVGVYAVSPTGDTLRLIQDNGDFDHSNDKVLATSTMPEYLIGATSGTRYELGSDLWCPDVSFGMYRMKSEHGTPFTLITYNSEGTPRRTEVSSGDAWFNIDGHVVMSTLVPPKDLPDGTVCTLSRNVIVTACTPEGIYLQNAGSKRIPVVFVKTTQQVEPLTEVSNMPGKVTNGELVATGTIETIYSDQKVQPVYCPIEHLSLTFHVYTRTTGTVTVVASDHIELDGKLHVTGVTANVGDRVQVDGVYDSGKFVASKIATIDETPYF